MPPVAPVTSALAPASSTGGTLLAEAYPRMHASRTDPTRPADPQLQLPGGERGAALREAERHRADGRVVRLRHGSRDGPSPPDPRRGAARELDARGQRDPRRTGGPDRAGEPEPARGRHHLPQSGAARE